MNRARPHIRLAAWITLCCALFALVPAPSAAKGEARGEEFVFDVPYPSPPWVADKVSWPATVLVIRCERGDVTGDGLRRVKVIPRIANGSYSDLKVTVVMELLDADGNVVASETETDGVEEEEISPFSFRLKIPEQEAATIETCRVTLKAEPK